MESVMTWDKKGLIYAPKPNGTWMVSHAQLPVVDKVDPETLRVFYGTRDANSRTVTTYIDVAADNPKQVVYVHDAPVLGLGDLGCFDDGGSMPSWIVNHGGLKYLYYIGWNAGVSVSYRNSIGIAVSDNGGRSFTRVCKGPILDRTKTEEHFCGASCVLVEAGIWRMWYLGCVRWDVIDGKPEPIYNIRYAESENGIDWERDGTVAIPLLPGEGGLTRPCVLREDGMYRMWYSRRGMRDYRANPKHSYRVGYAESDDGIEWVRRDEEAGIEVSEDGWDSVMVTYAHVYEHAGRLHMIYNGNGFGASGFGYAVLK